MAKVIADLRKEGIDLRLRDFQINPGAQMLPPGFEAWSPDAVIAYLEDDYRSLFESLKQGGRPLIHNSGLTPGEGEVLVVGNSADAYRVIHEHFRGIGRKRIAAHFDIKDSGGRRHIKYYCEYCEAQGVACDIITCPQGIVQTVNDTASPLNLDSEVARWLSQIEEPVGIFAAEDYLAGHLCRLCQALGLCVPDDVAIIGTGGFEQQAWADPPQTGICFDTDRVADRSIRLALQLIQGKPMVEDMIRVDSAQLIVRGSTVAKENQGLDVQKALAFIDAHAVEGVSMNDIVEYTQGVSRQTFVKHFKAETGMTPNDAIRDRKIDEARRILRDTDISITMLSRSCGFCDDAHFRRVFSQTVGCTPSAYRKMQRAD